MTPPILEPLDAENRQQRYHATLRLLAEILDDWRTSQSWTGGAIKAGHVRSDNKVAGPFQSMLAEIEGNT